VVKLVFLLRRLPALTQAEFQRYWRETHGPLVRRHASVLGIRRYVQCHALDTPYGAGLRATRGTAEPYDGVAEVWWDGLDEMAAGTRTPEGRAAGSALFDDERRFIDHAGSSMLLCEEHPFVGSA
jgi:uncharacterized protein (TIGR02118 family)